jgi:hypothetical protein
VHASAGGTSRELFERLMPNFTCRLVLFRYANTRKDPAEAAVLASADFRPTFGANAAAFEVSRFLGSTQPGANFPIGNGLGVGVILEKTSPGTLSLPRSDSARLFVRIHSVTLDFSARPRDESVTV